MRCWRQLPRNAAERLGRYTYDGAGRMTKVEEPNPTLDTPLVTTYTYNVLGKLTNTAQGAQTRTFNFDSLGRMTSQVLPESGTTSFTYDVDGLLLTKTDARNVTTTLTYNSLGNGPHKLSQKTYSDSTPQVMMTYDSAGRRNWMMDGLGEVNYFYDTADRLTEERRTLYGPPTYEVLGIYSTRYSYNIKGDITQMTYPSGRVVNFNYATGGGCCNSRLDSVVDQTTNTTINGSLTYNAAGETLSHTLGNGVAQSYTYNNRLQLTGITSSLSGTTLMKFGYDYGSSTQNTGRVLSRTDNIQQEHSTKYTYDSIYRLGQAIAADASWGAAWTFDTWGNRLTQTPQGLAQSLNKVGTQTNGFTNNRLNGNTYDNAGNQTNDGLHNYTFNAENQITQMDGGAAVYAYDGEGRRMKKTVGSETTYYFYGVGGLLCEFTTTNTGATQAASTNRATYRTSDKLGSAVLIMNSSGTVIENNRTLPYGEAWIAENTPSTNDKKFTSYQRDQESGLDYAMNRFYSFTAGRFASIDPLDESGKPGRPSTWNRYVYVANDPINWIDPLGLDAWACMDCLMADDGSILSGGGGGVSCVVTGDCAEEIAHNQRVQNTVDGARANAALQAGDYMTTLGIVLNNPNVQLERIPTQIASTAVSLPSRDAFEGSLPSWMPDWAKAFLWAVFTDPTPGPSASKGLTPPAKYFANQTAKEVSEALTKRFGPAKSVRDGAETFYNPRTQRSFNVHTDPAHGAPHVDIRRRGGYPERKYPLGN